MLLLGSVHIGEVQASVWDAATLEACRQAGIPRCKPPYAKQAARPGDPGQGGALCFILQGSSIRIAWSASAAAVHRIGRLILER